MGCYLSFFGSKSSPSIDKKISVNRNPTPEESQLGKWLDEQAQNGGMGLIKRVRGMPEGTSGAGNPDYHLFSENLDNAELQNPSLSPNLSGDAVAAESNNIDNIVSNAASSKSGRQAEVEIVEIGSRGRGGEITNEAVRAWKLNDIKTTFPRLRRLVVVQNNGGVRSSILDLEVR